MESAGDEKRIRALFSDLALEDQRQVPRFEKLWARAETNARGPLLISMRSVTVSGAVVVFAALCLVATASWYASSDSEQSLNVPPQNIPTTSVRPIMKSEQHLSAGSKIVRTNHERRPLRRRQTERIATDEVVALSNWQSPTSAFLEAPTAFALSSLPQLNQSARDLESFLPKNSEVIKESKQ